MRLYAFIACLLATFPACAKGGAQQFQYDTGYSFRDVIGQTYANHYGWNSAQIVASSRAVKSSTHERFPGCCVAWTIQHGDDPLAEGNNHERNEVLGMFGGGATDEAPGTTKYYALSVYIPSGWIDPVDAGIQWFIVYQLHGDDTNVGHSGQAPFQFALANWENTADHYTLHTVGGPIGTGGSIPAADDVVTDLGPHVYDTWVDFVFKVTWASDVEGTGHVTVWKRVVGTDSSLVQIADYAAPTLYSSSGVTQLTNYWKHGIYRGDDGTQGTITIYMGPVCRATTMRDAATCAFNQWP